MATITYNLFWQGIDGYTAKGFFSYDDQTTATLITREDLEDLQLTIFSPNGTEISSFDYGFPFPQVSGEFNFAFDTTTETILQSGNFDTETGFDLGIDSVNETGLDFYSFVDEGETESIIALDEFVTPGTDEGLIAVDEGGILINALSGTIDPSLPTVSISSDRFTPLSESEEESGSFIFTLSEPAPAAGLTINIESFDSDGIPGDVALSTTNATIEISEDNKPFQLIIDPGATEAQITLTAIADDEVEANEISSIIIEPGTDYNIDSENYAAALRITDKVSQLITYNLSWEGDGGYTASGSFTYDQQNVGNTVNEDNLEDFQITFFSPEGEEIDSFDYDFPNPDPSGEFNFQFDTLTETVLQSSDFNTEAGFDLGVDSGTQFGVDFYTLGGISLSELGEETFVQLDEGGVLLAIDNSGLITYNLFWQGAEAYTAFGSFTYNEENAGTIVTENDLEDLQLTIYSPFGEELADFDYGLPNPDVSGEFNFKFDTISQTVLQSGNFDTETGFDLGIDSETEIGLDFYSFVAEGETESIIALDEFVTPGTDEGLIEVDEGGVLRAIDTELDLPEVSLTVDENTITEAGEDLAILTFSFSEPVPTGGLTLNINIIDPDVGTPDTSFPPETITGITDFGQGTEDENGITQGTLTVAAGVTEATFGLQAINDDVLEGNEVFGVSLAFSEEYTIDEDNFAVEILIVDNQNESPTDSTLIFGTSGNDNEIDNPAIELTSPDAIANLVFSGAGEDLIDSSIGNSPARDRLYSGSDADEVFAGESDRAFGSDGDDILSTFGDNSRLYGGSDDDELIILDAGENNRLFGGDGDDILELSLSGENNRAYGGDGDDLFGLGTGDVVVGGDGDDIFLLQGGNNQVTGGTGSDQFWVLTSTDLPDSANTFTDLDLTEDVIGIGGGVTAEQISFDGDTLLVDNQAVATFTGVTGLTTDDLTFGNAPSVA
ncbi:MAG: hypothetical protein SAJ37_18150 [Oscillatoria sp. PMC 1068.18]|nr:hypothetical protein [Oscillatoria sp. PMC 1076.18]MEC4990658.1 hypothetical protein [Oscillatoria sp. PMC 1068.18]